MAGYDHDITILNALITTTIDSANGFEDAAEDDDASTFRSMFQDFAQERRLLVARLQDRVRQLGGTPSDDGSLKAGMHRRWEDLKKAITGREDRAVIDEVERGEDHIKETYAATLADRSISQPTREVIEQCFTSVLRGHDTVARLKHSMQRAEA